MVSKRWEIEAFKHVTVVDSYFCCHHNSARQLPAVAFAELPKYLHKNIRRFFNLTELSLACRWWFTDKFLSRHVRFLPLHHVLFIFDANFVTLDTDFNVIFYFHEGSK
jgi:hypothetical protein